jgi:hypothetical protein
MTDYEAMWKNSVEEVNWLTEQNQRLKGNKRENPTLRDQFAMAALTGILAYGKRFDVSASDDAYSFAEAMMVERDI